MDKVKENKVKMSITMDAELHARFVDVCKRNAFKKSSRIEVLVRRDLDSVQPLVREVVNASVPGQPDTR